MNPCATILALCFTTSLFSILFQEDNWCRYCLWIPSHYWARSFLPRLYPLLEFSPSVVHTLPWPWSLDLNHLKGFCNLVEKCMSTIVDFRLYVSPESIYQYIVMEISLPMVPGRDFPMRLSRVFRCPGHCVHYDLGWWRFPVHLVYTTHQLSANVKLTCIYWFMGLDILSCEKLNPDVLLPYISPCCFERGVEWIYWYLHSFSRTSAGL